MNLRRILQFVVPSPLGRGLRGRVWRRAKPSPHPSPSGRGRRGLSDLSTPRRKIELDPLAILFDESAWPFDRKAARETGIAFQKAIDGRVIARGHTPVPIFTDEVLLHDQLSVGIEGLGDMRVHGCINYCQVSRDAWHTNLNPIELI